MWEGYEEPSWEEFSGFVKDTAHMVEKYIIRNLITPMKSLRRQVKSLKAEQREQVAHQFPKAASAEGLQLCQANLNDFVSMN